MKYPNPVDWDELRELLETKYIPIEERVEAARAQLKVFKIKSNLLKGFIKKNTGYFKEIIRKGILCVKKD